MWQLAAAFAEVALRRRGPERLPDSTFLALAVLAVYLLLSLITLAMDDGLSWRDLALMGGETTLYLAFVFAVLTFFKLERRYRQTICAMLGADAFITAVYLPFAVAGLGFGMDLAASPFLWFRLGFWFWSVSIAACILARSLSQPLIVGFMFQILYVLTSLSIFDFLSVEPDSLNTTSG